MDEFHCEKNMKEKGSVLQSCRVLQAFNEEGKRIARCFRPTRRMGSVLHGYRELQAGHSKTDDDLDGPVQRKLQGASHRSSGTRYHLRGISPSAERPSGRFVKNGFDMTDTIRKMYLKK